MTFGEPGCRMSLCRTAIIGSEGQGTSEGVMENLRRKERDASATVSEASSLAVRTKLRPPLLREDVVARQRLLAWRSGALQLE
jgi:hypothetical protein